MPKNKARALIPNDQISLAIGKEGQNVRLAAKLTGWKIDVRSVEQIEQEKAAGLREKPGEEKTGEKEEPPEKAQEETSQDKEPAKEKPSKKKKAAATEKAAPAEEAARTADKEEKLKT